ncbi:hypothetical protein C8J57DRAFT_1599275 [Mycena rebaudengoi]|nr:hypothetical protein C8J57DRAFT_1599275 [Mycena rebaudengoi]
MISFHHRDSRNRSSAKYLLFLFVDQSPASFEFTLSPLVNTIHARNGDRKERRTRRRRRTQRRDAAPPHPEPRPHSPADINSPVQRCASHALVSYLRTLSAYVINGLVPPPPVAVSITLPRTWERTAHTYSDPASDTAPPHPEPRPHTPADINNPPRMPSRSAVERAEKHHIATRRRKPEPVYSFPPSSRLKVLKSTACVSYVYHDAPSEFSTSCLPPFLVVLHLFYSSICFPTLRPPLFLAISAAPPSFPQIEHTSIPAERAMPFQWIIHWNKIRAGFP